MNILDTLFIISVGIALAFRLTGKNGYRIIARLIYSVNTIFWVVKLMEFLLINKNVGILIIIASRMVIVNKSLINNFNNLIFKVDRFDEFYNNFSHFTDEFWFIQTIDQISK